MIYFKNGTLIVRFGGELGGLPHMQMQLLFCDQLNDESGALVPKVFKHGSWLIRTQQP